MTWIEARLAEGRAGTGIPPVVIGRQADGVEEDQEENEPRQRPSFRKKQQRFLKMGDPFDNPIQKIGTRIIATCIKTIPHEGVCCGLGPLFCGVK